MITAETDYATAKTEILAGVGASLPERDPVDVRLVADAENETNVGTYPRSASAARTLAANYYSTELDAWYA